MRLLAERAGGEHLGDEVDVAGRDVDPGGVELHDVLVLERLEEVDLAVEALQVVGALQEVVQLHLVPRHLHPLVLVERPVPETKPAARRQQSARPARRRARKNRQQAASERAEDGGSYTVLDAPLPRTSLYCKKHGAKGSAIWHGRETN